MCFVERSVGLRVGGIHEVHTRQIFVRRHDVQIVLARNIHEVGQTCATCHEDALKSFILKLLCADGFTNDYVSLEVHTHLLQVVDFNVDNLVGQTEFGNTVLQHTANLVQGFEHVHFIAQLRHIASERKAGRT